MNCAHHVATCSKVRWPESSDYKQDSHGKAAPVALTWHTWPQQQRAPLTHLKCRHETSARDCGALCFPQIVTSPPQHAAGRRQPAVSTVPSQCANDLELGGAGAPRRPHRGVHATGAQLRFTTQTCEVCAWQLVCHGACGRLLQFGMGATREGRPGRSQAEGHTAERRGRARERSA